MPMLTDHIVVKGEYERASTVELTLFSYGWTPTLRSTQSWKCHQVGRVCTPLRV